MFIHSFIYTLNCVAVAFNIVPKIPPIAQSLSVASSLAFLDVALGDYHSASFDFGVGLVPEDTPRHRGLFSRVATPVPPILVNQE